VPPVTTSALSTSLLLLNTGLRKRSCRRRPDQSRAISPVPGALLPWLMLMGVADVASVTRRGRVSAMGAQEANGSSLSAFSRMTIRQESALEMTSGEGLAVAPSNPAVA